MKRDSSNQAVSTAEGLVFLFAVSLLGLASISLADDLSAPDRSIVWESTSGIGGGGGGGGGGGTNSSETNGPLSYAVINLGTNYAPVKIVNNGEILAYNAVWTPSDQTWHPLTVSLPGYLNQAPAYGQFRAVDINDQGEIVGWVNLDHGYSTNGPTAYTATNSETAGVIWAPGSYSGTISEAPNSYTWGSAPNAPATNVATVTNTDQQFAYVAIDAAGTKYNQQVDSFLGGIHTNTSGTGVWLPLITATNLYQETNPLTTASLTTDTNGSPVENGLGGGLVAVSSNNYVYYTYPIYSTVSTPPSATTNFTVVWDGSTSATTTNQPPPSGYYLNNSNWLVGPAFNNPAVPALYRGPHGSGQQLPITPVGINNRSYTDTNGNIYPDYQIISTNVLAESATDNNGFPTGIYGPQTTTTFDSHMAVWSNTIAASFNDGGVVVGSADDAPSKVMLLPCQFRLLNGSANTADVDGAFFDGTRPSTISATASFDAKEPNTLAGNQGIDVLGVDVPLGTGRPDFPGQCDTYSLMMLAKVSPPTATNITYGWDRTYKIRFVSISQTATNTWDVRGYPYPTGPNEDTGTNSYYTVIPSTNQNVIAFSDTPAMNISPLTNSAPKIGDYLYQKFHFVYSATNSIGSTNAVATQDVGVRTLVQRTGTNGVIASDWTNIYNIASTTNVPDTGITTSEIRNIVHGSNLIIIEPSATSNYP